MASPRVIVQIVLTGSRILGKAFLEAGRQAVKNVQHRPAGAMGGADVAGVGNATTGSMTDQLTRQHRMTLDEAHLILNAKRGEELEKILENYEHLFKANSPPPPPAPSHAKPKALPAHSHYLQSKVVRARERIEAELQIANEKPAENTAPNAQAPPPPSDTPTGGSS
ncbi:mitochondrial import inner membrane translocase subunit TIM16 [Marasmius crinis-equi]|uniref:Mitochondrial import inner membrane translocase subunit TIM16 n=1 Tax=Marasmius crinis-equi TaxID=585013 RepID=A0ABR3FKB1_9AGAR